MLPWYVKMNSTVSCRDDVQPVLQDLTSAAEALLEAHPQQVSSGSTAFRMMYVLGTQAACKLAATAG